MVLFVLHIVKCSYYANSICNGTDVSLEAKCYNGSVYTKSLPVVRLSMDRVQKCTGWLVGDEGHILTNWHCVRNGNDTIGLVVEGLAEGRDCEEDCRTPMSCESELRNEQEVAFVMSGGSFDEDYTLLQLMGNDTLRFGKLGFLVIRTSGAVVEETIYLPQHPRGGGKRIAMLAGNQTGTILATQVGNFNGCGEDQVAYALDTSIGSSGSPVIAFKDHKVVAMHHCGGCDRYANSGVPATKLAARLSCLLPKVAFV